MPDDRFCDAGQLRRAVRQLDWRDTGFSLEKAHVCALFSQLAYMKVAEFELGDADRANLIPCEAFRALVSGTATLDFEAVLASLEIGPYFSTVRRYSIVVGVRAPNVIFLSLRGTSSLCDLLVDLDTRFSSHSDGRHTAGFHAGFHRAVEECRRPVLEGLETLQDGGEVPVHVTDHSLGGAMTAIMNASWSETDAVGAVAAQAVDFAAAYCFGMPHYGNEDAVYFFRPPFHLLNEEDPVPNLPPTWMGFRDPADEWALDGEEAARTYDREPYDVGRWLYHLATLRPFAAHTMEVYRERIEQALRNA